VLDAAARLFMHRDVAALPGFDPKRRS
jgi:hypothetical protein